ncbi:hypothetical protein [Terrabacter sp. NPDC000476]|uniref:hypothetical protein n=1 Tax=Terrabacter sp. NPDC000476 TaxID=3154258 RepID=UPI00331C9579
MRVPDGPEGEGALLRVRARVRHEADRSYAVLVEGPDGEVLVGITRETGQVYTLAREGAARLFDVPVERIAGEYLDVVIPRPPYGSDGQWVRVVSAGESTNPDDLVDVGTAGQGYWFGPEGAWLVVLPGSGAGIYPSEYLDFEPRVSDEEVAALERHLRSGKAPE